MLENQRPLFRLPDDRAYLNCAYTSPLLIKAEQAGNQALRTKAQPWNMTSRDFFTNLEGNRALFAELINTNADNIAIIPAVSYGMAVAANNLPIEKGQAILVLDEQFPSHVYPWRKLAREREARIVTTPRPNDDNWSTAVLQTLDELGDRLAIAALPHCHWTDGGFIDLVKIGQRCRQVGAALVIDTTQSLGAMPFDIQAVQPDFVASTSHKWLLGAYNYGFMYVAPKWQEGAPLEENWLNREGSQDFSRLVDYRDAYQPGARRFDVGEASNFTSGAMVREALTQILEWGVMQIAATIAPMTQDIAKRAGNIGLGVCSPQLRGPHMLGLRAPNGLPNDLTAQLAAKNVHVSVRGDSIRVAPHVYTTPQDIDRFFHELQQILC